MTRRKSLVLLSGGLDSSANLAFAHHFDELSLALTIDYGQRAAKKEIEAAKRIAQFYQVPHRVIEIPWLGELGGSALTDKGRHLPSLTQEDLNQEALTQKSGNQVWVPNRNAVLIQVAAAIAEAQSIAQVVVGFNKEEAETFPDNSSAFLGVVNLGLRFSTKAGVKVACYTDMMIKKEIVQSLRRLPIAFPFEMLWSCYDGKSEPCGICESCRRFQRAMNDE